MRSPFARRREPALPPVSLRFMGEDDEEFVEVGDALAEALERHAGLGPESSLLDIGCGYGRLAHGLVRRGFRGRYLGIDILARHVSWCADNLGGRHLEFRHVDIANDRYNPGGELSIDDLELGGERFDVIALFSVFTHLWPEDIISYLRLATASLRPAGRLLATFFLLDEEWHRLEASGELRTPMPHAHGRCCRYQSPDDPLHRIGYELDWVTETAAGLGLSPTGPPQFGTWSGREATWAGAAAYQDAVVLAPASGAGAPR